MLDEGLPSRYRVGFEDGTVYRLDFSVMQRDGVRQVWGVAYRVEAGRFAAKPLSHPDGRPVQFTGPTEEAALSLACEVLQAVSGSRPISIRFAGRELTGVRVAGAR